MASGAVVNQGKTPFVETYFTNHPDGTLETVNKAWTAAGNEGSVSESLVGKVRGRLGLTGKKAAEEPLPFEAPAKPKSKKPAKTAKVAKPAKPAPAPSNGTHPPVVVSATTSHDEDVLDELEEEIDVLIQKIRGLGGKVEVVKALRRARRLLVRTNEG